MALIQKITRAFGASCCILLAFQLRSQSVQLPTQAKGAIGILSPGDLGHPNHYYIAKALGDRLLTPGKERMTINATITDSRGSRPLQYIWELPGQIRAQDSISPAKVVTHDNGNSSVSVGNTLDDNDNDLLETLGSDTAEGFLYSITQKVAMRFLQGRFRIDDGKAANYTGPYLEIYQMHPSVTVRTDKPNRAKFYMFDFKTGLISRVSYDVDSAAGKSKVEVFYEGWRSINGQQVPATITRKANGITKFSIAPTAAAFAPKTLDNAFKAQ